MNKKLVSDIFLKKVTFWDDKQMIYPVDLSDHLPLRKQFSEEIHNRPLSAVKNYWQQMIFSGRGVPPLELPSEAAVIDYVLKHTNAIGYISHVDAKVKVKKISIE
jgi:hypothetical protein